MSHCRAFWTEVDALRFPPHWTSLLSANRNASNLVELLLPVAECESAFVRQGLGFLINYLVPAKTVGLNGLAV
jgi:hypothetical protein